jgi:hypothetical protein
MAAIEKRKLGERAGNRKTKAELKPNWPNFGRRIKILKLD